MKAYLSRIGRKLTKLIDNVTYDVKGNPGQLLTTEVHGNLPKFWSFVIFNDQIQTYEHDIPPYIRGDAKSWFNNRDLTPEQVVCEAVTLFGEIQIQQPAEIIIPWLIELLETLKYY